MLFIYFILCQNLKNLGHQSFKLIILFLGFIIYQLDFHMLLLDQGLNENVTVCLPGALAFIYCLFQKINLYFSQITLVFLQRAGILVIGLLILNRCLKIALEPLRVLVMYLAMALVFCGLSLLPIYIVDLIMALGLYRISLGFKEKEPLFIVYYLTFFFGIFGFLFAPGYVKGLGYLVGYRMARIYPRLKSIARISRRMYQPSDDELEKVLITERVLKVLKTETLLLLILLVDIFYFPDWEEDLLDLKEDIKNAIKTIQEYILGKKKSLPHQQDQQQIRF
uniref:Uncharacterized protein n=1 Tax=Glaucocystis sp. BBH TaxID=2023628 RepID=A0A3G1IUX3_9EUKA|nr:hypothetical protein [Glaucocystis sp. BBH]ASQ39834.1 hypothetical protein [Glaucocystis sp. BBH]